MVWCGIGAFPFTNARSGLVVVFYLAEQKLPGCFRSNNIQRSEEAAQFLTASPSGLVER